MKIKPYSKEVALSYDKTRFTTPFGRKYNLFETSIVRQAFEAYNGNHVGVLEVGCGTGRLLDYLYRANRGIRFVGIDPSKHMLEESKKRNESIDWRVFDGLNIPFDDYSFSFVYCVRVLNQTKDLRIAERLIREMVRVATDGGIILFEYVNSERIFKKRSDALRLSKSQVLDIAGPGVRQIFWKGSLLFSMTFHQLLDRFNSSLVSSLFLEVDLFLSNFLQNQCSRCFLAFEKLRPRT